MWRTSSTIPAAVTIGACLVLSCAIEEDSIDDVGEEEDGGGQDGGLGGLDVFYDVTNLVTDTQTNAEHVDPDLVNPWGLAFGPETIFWVANEGTATATLHDEDGRSQSDAVGGPIDIPAPAGLEVQGGGADEDAGPTGLVYNGGDGFEIQDGVPSRFVFATLSGTILGWSAEADNPRRAVIMVDNSTRGAAYTGLAITGADAPLLLAANFADAAIDVYDDRFAAVELGDEAFVDPMLPDRYAPFAVHEIDGLVYVAYAQQDAEAMEEETGPGLGRVGVFDADGMLVDRIEETENLDAPWGLALAPPDFGRFAGALLVGNFGDGRITAFDADSYDMLGQLERSDGVAVEIAGLWAIAFGNDEMAGDHDDLYFTAGPDDEMHGVFGVIEVQD